MEEDQARDKGVKLVIDVAADVPETVYGDPGRVRQILMNLVGNSIKFTEKWEISIGVALKAEDEGAAIVRFQVRDTGIGIPQESMADIFKPFSQAHHLRLVKEARPFDCAGLQYVHASPLVLPASHLTW